ncbi:MAG: pyridoxal-phosphate dependent enzyme [Thermoplasmata archaeon]|nr:pyridoxal-phosphate dependent enzyme [Thermoplasmata archaeon]
MADRPSPSTILDLIGETPVLPLHRVGKELGYRILAKLEYLNPGGSVKDRIGTRMIDEAEAKGWLKPGGTIVEATSGNTGVGLALVAAVRGYHSVFVLPDKMSAEKIRLLRAYGARVVVTPSQLAPDHPMSHYSVARRLAKEIPGAYYPNQYENAGNPDAHYHTTGPEISRQGGETLGAVVATIGTGGTISGIGRYFKEHRPNVRIVAVDPKGSVLGHYFRTHELTKVTPYLVEGIGEDMIPKTVHFQYIDEFVEVNDRESFSYARRLVREEGLFVGGSSGAAVAGVLRWLSTRPIPTGSTVVVLLPDSGDRYLSKFYSDEWMREKGLLDDQGRAADLVRAKAGVPSLVSVEPTTVVRDALELLRKHEVSQLPVLAGTENVGSVTEEEILQRALADETVLERTVSSLLAPPFPEVAADAPLGELLVRLKESRAVLVRESGGKRPVGLLTRRDVFAFLSHPEESHAV